MKDVKRSECLKKYRYDFNIKILYFFIVEDICQPKYLLPHFDSSYICKAKKSQMDFLLFS